MRALKRPAPVTPCTMYVHHHPLRRVIVAKHMCSFTPYTLRLAGESSSGKGGQITPGLPQTSGHRSYANPAPARVRCALLLGRCGPPPPQPIIIMYRRAMHKQSKAGRRARQGKVRQASKFKRAAHPARCGCQAGADRIVWRMPPPPPPASLHDTYIPSIHLPTGSKVGTVCLSPFLLTTLAAAPRKKEKPAWPTSPPSFSPPRSPASGYGLNYPAKREGEGSCTR